MLLDFYKEGEATEEEVNELFQKLIIQLEELELKNMLSSEEDHLDAVLQITAGAGGTESCDWSSMLLRMYLMWGEKNGYKIRELHSQDGDVAGIKTVTLEISGDFAFGYLKGENGVHRLVRVSPFNAQGKRMTSFSSVYVYPSVDDTIEIEINPADISWDTFRSGGAGGQTSDISIAAKEILRWRQTINEILSQHSGKTIEQLEKDSDRDYYMSAEEARDYGLVDEVISKKPKE